MAPHVAQARPVTGSVSAQPPRKLSSAGRLLREVLASDSADPAAIARGLGVGIELLEACRSGAAQLTLEQQMRLAALVLMVAPEHARRARALYAQAQAALRMQVGEVSGHMTYPREQFR